MTAKMAASNNRRTVGRDKAIFSQPISNDQLKMWLERLVDEETLGNLYVKPRQPPLDTLESAPPSTNIAQLRRGWTIPDDPAWDPYKGLLYELAERRNDLDIDADDGSVSRLFMWLCRGKLVGADCEMIRRKLVCLKRKVKTKKRPFTSVFKKELLEWSPRESSCEPLTPSEREELEHLREYTAAMRAFNVEHLRLATLQMERSDPLAVLASVTSTVERAEAIERRAAAKREEKARQAAAAKHRENPNAKRAEMPKAKSKPCSHCRGTDHIRRSSLLCKYRGQNPCPCDHCAAQKRRRVDGVTEAGAGGSRERRSNQGKTGKAARYDGSKTEPAEADRPTPEKHEGGCDQNGYKELIRESKVQGASSTRSNARHGEYAARAVLVADGGQRSSV